MAQDLDFIVGDNAKAMLISAVERIERLEEEIKGLSEDKTEVFKEAKSAGFDTKTLRKVISLRKMDPDDRAQAAALLELYMEATKDAVKA